MVREPLDGWHERGYVGAALGAYVGIAGAFLKPASGLLECLAKTASGVGSAVRSWGEAPVRFASPTPALENEDFSKRCYGTAGMREGNRTYAHAVHCGKTVAERTEQSSGCCAKI